MPRKQNPHSYVVLGSESGERENIIQNHLPTMLNTKIFQVQSTSYE